MSLLTALIILFTSKDNSEVFQAIRMLGLQDYKGIILIGKKMIHPKYIDEKDLIHHGIDEENIGRN